MISFVALALESHAQIDARRVFGTGIVHLALVPVAAFVSVLIHNESWLALALVPLTLFNAR